jgi:hypothetical protein
VKPPQLVKIADRSYVLVLPFNVGNLRQHLQGIGARYTRRTDDALYSHRWVLDTRAGRSVITLFPSGRLVILGPAVEALDELTIAATVERMPDGGVFLAFEGEGGER